MTEEYFKILTAFAVLCNYRDSSFEKLNNGDYKSWFEFHTTDEMKNFVEVCTINGFDPEPGLNTAFFNWD